VTSLAFVLGTPPLAIATGASANSRHSIGTGVIGGTLASTVIAIFFTPMFYWSLQTVSQKLFGAPVSAGPASDAAAHPRDGELPHA
jgi:multidrug efflux pump